MLFAQDSRCLGIPERMHSLLIPLQPLKSERFRNLGLKLFRVPVGHISGDIGGFCCILAILGAGYWFNP